ncbi:hypothetical protein Hypma_015473 [Hypsizygus marmoreus]|uniref:Elongator complex protein 5 n=1 Tax=Hypsizygus marmoreus TaxID=39966 RepID=A0A369K4M0_HYPMA|nr:hypothetical protein Hypma_015473 [Hypsizygus marmoreus]
MSLLSKTIQGSSSSQPPLLLLQSSIAQSTIPLIRQILSHNLKRDDGAKPPGHILLFCFVYSPLDLLNGVSPHPNYLEVHDWTDNVPGYTDDWFDPRNAILSLVQSAPAGPIHVIIDSVDTLSSDVGPTSETYKVLREVLALVHSRPSPSRLVLNTLKPSNIIPLLTQPAFSPSLVQLIAHPPVLLAHLAKDYLTPPPPASPEAKFWAAFIPLSERGHDIDRLVFGADGEGSGGATEMVVEVLVRWSENFGKKRGVERVLEGWSSAVPNGVCELTRLESLKTFWTAKTTEQLTPDPTQLASFNLSLTSSQQESRAQVPLPYAHEGNLLVRQTLTTTAAILYDPDSADDIDDDDPDEDLDI